MPIFGNTNTIDWENDPGAADLYPSEIEVSGLTGGIESLKVTLNNFSHTYPSDIDILLVGATGEKAMEILKVQKF